MFSAPSGSSLNRGRQSQARRSQASVHGNRSGTNASLRTGTGTGTASSARPSNSSDISSAPPASAEAEARAEQQHQQQTSAALAGMGDSSRESVRSASPGALSVDASGSGGRPGAGKKRSSWVNLSVPQPSYAYGAPSDDSFGARNSKIHARLGSASPRLPGDADASTSQEFSQDGALDAPHERSVSAPGAQEGAPPPAEHNALPARARYAELRKRKESAAAMAAEASAKRRAVGSGGSASGSVNGDASMSAAGSTGATRRRGAGGAAAARRTPRRSARLSDAGSQAGERASLQGEPHEYDDVAQSHVSETQFPGANGTATGTIEEELDAADDADGQEQDDEVEEVRHSQRGGAAAAAGQPARHSRASTGAGAGDNTAAGSASGAGRALHSFFMRQRASLSPAPQDDSNASMHEPSSLLRGAQKPSADPLAVYRNWQPAPPPGSARGLQNRHQYQQQQFLSPESAADGSVSVSASASQSRSYSYDYAAEEDLAREFEAEAQGGAHLARGGGNDDSASGHADADASANASRSFTKSWIGALRSPFMAIAPGASRAANVNGNASADINGSSGHATQSYTAAADQSRDSNASQRTTTQRRRKARVSRDSQSYRPDPADLANGGSDDSDSDGSADADASNSRSRSRKHTHRRAAGRAKIAGAGLHDQGGRDDARIWAAGKRRKGRRKAANGAQALNGEAEHSEDEEESSELSEPDEEQAEQEQEDGAAPATLASKRGPRAQARTQAGANKSGPRSILPANFLGLLSPVTLFAISGLLLALLALLLPSGLGVPASLSSRGAFHAPDLAPADLPALIARLRKLEAAVASLGDIGGDVRGVRTELARTRQDLSSRLSALERAESASKKTIEALEAKALEVRRELARSIDALGRQQQALQDELAGLHAQLSSVQTGASAGSNVASAGTGLSDAEAKSILKRISSLEKELGRSRTELAAMSAAREQADQRHSQLDKRLDAIVKSLPAQMPVRKDAKTGHVQIDPAFWLELKKVLKSKDDSDGAPASADAWTQFRSANENALRIFIQEELSARSSGSPASDTLISRDDFRALLDSEMALIKTEMAARFNQNLDGLRDEMWDKIRKTGDAYKASGSLSSGSSGLLGKLFDDTKAVPLTLQDGSDGREAVLAMIDAALEKYSADRIGKQDYALYSAGGRVLPSLTSPTYELGASKSWLSKLLPGSSSDSSIVRGRAPVVAIHHDNSPGMCWPFAGDNGQLGVALSQSVVVSDITIDHAPQSLVGNGIASAPREVTVWGLMQSAEDKRRAAEHRRLQAEMPDAQPLPAPPSDDYVHLGSYIYDASAGSRATQTFPVPADIRALGIKTGILRFRVTSNWGNPDYTCLYRLRVHGDPAAA